MPSEATEVAGTINTVSAKGKRFVEKPTPDKSTAQFVRVSPRSAPQITQKRAGFALNEASGPDPLPIALALVQAGPVNAELLAALLGGGE